MSTTPVGLVGDAALDRPRRSQESNIPSTCFELITNYHETEQEVINPPAVLPIADHSLQQPSNLRSACPVMDCDLTFSRKSDLDRHVNCCHRRDFPYTCPEIGCFKGPSPTRFARSDKLTDHMKAMHSHNKSRFLCTSIDGCQRQLPMTLEELAAHIKLDHLARQYDSRGRNDRNDLDLHFARSMTNATGKMRCLLWSCGTFLALSGYVQHICQHSDVELESMAASLHAAGYAIKEACPDAAVPVSPDDRRLTVKIQCPILGCQTTCAGHPEFAHHLVFGHLAKQDEAAQDHLLRWYEAIKTDGKKELSCFPWQLRDSGHRCPVCSFRKSAVYANSNSGFEHVARMFRSDEDVLPELEPHRIELLRLCPELYRHPLYNYLRSTATSGAS